MNIRLEIATARRIEQAETNTLLSRLTAIRDQEGNPADVHFKNFGDAKAFVVKGIPDPYFNSVRGLTAANMGHLDDILEFYRFHNVSCRIDIAPFDLNPEMLLKLAEQGYYQYGFHSSLFRGSKIESIVPYNNDAVIVRKLNEDEFKWYGEIYTKAFKMADFLAPAVGANNRVLYNKLGWHFYLASYHNVPAAIAVLYVQDRIGSLAAAGTLPEYQRKGCQTALLAARIKHAAQLDCDLIVGQASFGSISQINMERMGLRMAYTKSIWRKLPLPLL